jgi:hypothetical protein
MLSLNDTTVASYRVALQYAAVPAASYGYYLKWLL